MSPEKILKVENLVVTFPAGAGKKVHAVSDVSFELAKGETLGLVGESGCGKSTTGRAIMQLIRPAQGSVNFEGSDLTRVKGKELRRIRQGMQIIFQDPISSLNPRRRLKDIIAEPLDIWSKLESEERYDRVREMCDQVGLDFESVKDRRPHEFSGGQCQRISIARALMLSPKLLICDEPVSALDVSVQAQILNLLRVLKSKYDLSMIFIAHDLAVVKNISTSVAVMYLGRICETADSDTFYTNPAHPYTKALLESVPEPDPSLIGSEGKMRLSGELPSVIDPPSGCKFRTRCPYSQDICAIQEPELVEISAGHKVACHFPISR